MEKMSGSGWMTPLPKKSKPPLEYFPPLGSASKWEKCSCWDHFQLGKAIIYRTQISRGDFVCSFQLSSKSSWERDAQGSGGDGNLWEKQRERLFIWDLTLEEAAEWKRFFQTRETNPCSPQLPGRGLSLDFFSLPGDG